MTLKLFSSFAAGVALLATPIAASAAPVNPAASLSPVASTRAGSSDAHGSELAGGLFSGTGAIIAGVVVLGIIAIVAVGASTNDNPRSP